LAVMRNGEGYPDPTASSAIKGTFMPMLGHAYRIDKMVSVFIPLAQRGRTTIGYCCDVEIPYTNEYIVSTSMGYVDTRKVNNMSCIKYGEEVGSLADNEIEMLSRKMIEACGGDDTSALRNEVDALTEQVNRINALYESKKAELQIANEEIARLQSQPMNGDVVERAAHEDKLNVLFVKAKTERDVYKRLYEELLEKMLKGGA